MEVQMGTDSKRSKMALRVSAELCSGGSYLCGEKLHCRVHFMNESTSDDQVVAWCGAQLLCQCTFRENLVSPPSPPSGGLPKTQTAFLPSRGTLTRFESTPKFTHSQAACAWWSIKLSVPFMFICVCVTCVLDSMHRVVRHCVWSQCIGNVWHFLSVVLLISRTMSTCSLKNVFYLVHHLHSLVSRREGIHCTLHQSCRVVLWFEAKIWRVPVMWVSRDWSHWTFTVIYINNLSIPLSPVLCFYPRWLPVLCASDKTGQHDLHIHLSISSLPHRHTWKVDTWWCRQFLMSRWLIYPILVMKTSPWNVDSPITRTLFYSEGYPHHKGPTAYCEVHYRFIGTLKGHCWV